MTTAIEGAEPRSAKSSRLLENPPNARRTMEALRELGYDSYASVLDINDNCIDAHATKIDIEISEHKGDIIITIDDDGVGMDEETLSEALRLGSDTERESTDLGKFGMGLVTASIGLSQRVEVLSKEADGPLVHGGFDLEQIAAENRFIKWIGPAGKEHAASFTRPKGTRVRLSKTDRISNRNATMFANTLRSRIGQVFRKFLKSGVTITVNGKPVEPIDPLMLSDPTTKLVLDTEIPVDGKGSAIVRVVDLPDLGAAGNKSAGIIPQNSGFYIVRNNREIMEAHTFDFYKKHPDYSHFRAELSFDGSLDAHFHTDVKKMTIHPSQSFLDKLRQATQALITESGREGRARANAEKGQIDHSAAEANITRRASLIPKPKALIERRTPRNGKGTHRNGDGEKPRTPHVTHLRTISGLKVAFDEGDYGEQSPFYLVKQEGRTITVTYNREHPFYREFLEHASDPKVVAILDYLVFAIANSELLVPEQANIVKTNVNATLIGLLV
ncbi:MAG TPA: ATP-binding protein [Candidatus Udaeobacter sp.]|nr:ATP-binding protein [Candidatus Udaeobacter sp.]